MTIPQMKTLLESVNGFDKKVVYYEWPINEAPALPFVCFFSASETAFAADNINYYSVPRFAVELYTKTRDLTTEALFESKFRENDIYFTKGTEYLNDERCWVTVYTI